MTSADTHTAVAAKCESWSVSLQDLASELKTVAATTEDEFLTIGARLQDFYQRSCDIAAIGARMAEEGAGEQTLEATRIFGEMLDEMARYVTLNQQDTERNSATLTGIRTLLEQVAVPLAGFKKVNKVLRMLGISTKIESARLGNSAAGFDTLANDVGQLSVLVNEKAGVILSRKEELARVIEKTLQRVVRTGARQHELVVGLLEKTKRSLDALDAIRTRATAAVSDIAAAYQELSTNLGEIVMSMQTHDIVRQQIEHVEESLGELQQQIFGGSASADEVWCICELQTAQLRHADGSLDNAVRLIIVNLQEIASKQGDLLRQTAHLTGVADEAGSGFYQEMEHDLLVITGALSESLETGRNLCAAMEAVSGTVADIANFVGEIETVGEEIKLIALNAQIKSAYTGEDGAALGVLAEAIQRLSVEAIAHTAEVSRTLQAITEETERLFRQGESSGTTLDGDVERMVHTVTGLLQTLRGVKDALDSSLSHMSGEVRLLSSDVEETVGGISVHHRVSQVLQHAVQGLAAITGEARELSPDGAKAANLEEIARRYTMNSERQVHQSLMAGSAAITSSAAADDGLGDNVELF